VAVITGSLLATAPPLLALLHLHPGSLPFFGAAALGGVLPYTGSPVMGRGRPGPRPADPAAASGVVLGLITGVAGALHVGLGKLQEAIGLVEGMTVGLAMVIPAAAIVLVLLRHPLASGRPQRRPAPPVRLQARLNTPVYSLMARYGGVGLAPTAGRLSPVS
jgi:hypothetical protein